MSGDNRHESGSEGRRWWGRALIWNRGLSVAWKWAHLLSLSRRQHGAQFKESYHRDQTCCSSLACLDSTVWPWANHFLFWVLGATGVDYSSISLKSVDAFFWHWLSVWIKDLAIIYFITFSFGLLHCHINHVCLRLLVLDTLYLVWTKFFQIQEQKLMSKIS